MMEAVLETEVSGSSDNEDINEYNITEDTDITSAGQFHQILNNLAGQKKLQIPLNQYDNLIKWAAKLEVESITLKQCFDSKVDDLKSHFLAQMNKAVEEITGHEQDYHQRLQQQRVMESTEVKEILLRIENQLRFIRQQLRRANHRTRRENDGVKYEYEQEYECGDRNEYGEYGHYGDNSDHSDHQYEQGELERDEEPMTSALEDKVEDLASTLLSLGQNSQMSYARHDNSQTNSRRVSQPHTQVANARRSMIDPPVSLDRKPPRRNRRLTHG